MLFLILLTKAPISLFETSSYFLRSFRYDVIEPFLPRLFTLISSISFIFLFVFLILSSFGLIQSSEGAGLIGEASRWCERVSGGLFREP